MTSQTGLLRRSLGAASLLILTGAAVTALASSPSGSGDWPMWGGTPDRNMVTQDEGAPDRVGRQDQEEREVGGVHSVRRAMATRSSPAGLVFLGTNNEAMRDPKQPGRSWRADGVSRVRRRVHVAADPSEARIGAGQRLAVPGRRLVTARRGRRISTTSAIAAWSGASTSTASATTRTTVRSRTRSSPDRKDADAIWTFDMMEEVGTLSAQPGQLIAGHLGRPDLREHVERPGRKPRQHPVAAGAGHHRAQQEHRQAGLGRQLGRGSDSARPVVDAVGRDHRRRRPGDVGAGRRLGSRLRSARPARSCGSSTPIRRTRCGRAPATK